MAEVVDADRRTQIVRAAGELFAERGYASTTVRLIAERAGLLSGSLYHHFPSKGAILDELLTGFVDDLLTSARLAVDAADGDPARALRGLIQVSTQAIEAHRPAILLLQKEWSPNQRDDPSMAHIVEQGRQVGELWLQTLRSGIDTGVFRPDIEPATIYGLVRDAIWVVARWYRPDHGRTLADIADAYCGMVFGGLLAR